MMSAECSADGVGPCFACRCVAISLRSLLLIGIFASPDAFDFASLVERLTIGKRIFGIYD